MERIWVKYEEGSETDSDGVMEEEEKYDEEGLNTKLRPQSKSAMKGSEQLESFLTQVEREIFLQDGTLKCQKRKKKIWS